jgi:predicted nucleic acid-binding protein
MIVFSNTSPIMNLAVVGQADLLQQLYGKVMIPEAARQELVALRLDDPVGRLADASWIETRNVADRNLVESLLSELHPGEAEAIALAIQMKADLLLVDERRGRSVASRLNLKVMGLLGLLIEAKRKGLIEAVRPILDDLIA